MIRVNLKNLVINLMEILVEMVIKLRKTLVILIEILGEEILEENLLLMIPIKDGEISN
jgi:hypothetical protein